MENQKTDKRIHVFFYGSYINFDVLAEVDLAPEGYEVARLNGYDILFRPLANLVLADQHCVYGIVVKATHAELERLYKHAQHILGGTYLPEAVLIETVSGKWLPALCYIDPIVGTEKADKDYVERIVKPAMEYGFPNWYIEKLKKFAL